MKKKILCLAAAAALAASLTVPAWAAVASPYGGAEAEGGDVTYTTQAQTGEDSQATQVYETIQGAESTEQELGLLGDGLAETVQAELGETSVNEYRAREIGSVAVSRAISEYHDYSEQSGRRFGWDRGLRDVPGHRRPVALPERFLRQPHRHLHGALFHHRYPVRPCGGCAVRTVPFAGRGSAQE